MMRFASIKQIEIIGEAANAISADTKAMFTDLQWQQIIGMLHILVHEYCGVYFDLIWRVIISDLPVLKEKVQAVIDSI